MTKILHVSSGNLYGGIEVALRNWVKESTREFEHHFALSFEGKQSKELTTLGCPVFQFGNVRLRQPWSLLKAQSQLKQHFEHNTYDYVICHSSWAFLVAGATVRKAGLPLVFFAHNDLRKPRLLDRLAHTIQPDLVLANSEYTAEPLRAWFARSPVKVTYLPVPPVKPITHKRSELRKRWGASDHGIVLLQVARMEEGKGHLLLLDALTKLREERTWTLWIKGSPQQKREISYLNKVKARVESNQLCHRVVFIDEAIDSQELMGAADVYAQANILPESFGMVFIEALYQGLPIVSTQIGGAKEIVTSNCGRLAEPNSIDSVAECLRTLIQDEGLRNSMRDAGPKRARELCQPDRAVSHLHHALLGELPARSATG